MCNFINSGFRLISSIFFRSILFCIYRMFRFVLGSSSAQTQTSSAIKTLEKPEKMVKQSATSAGKKNIKLASKEAAKTTQRSVKTAEHPGKGKH